MNKSILQSSTTYAGEKVLISSSVDGEVVLVNHDDIVKSVIPFDINNKIDSSVLPTATAQTLKTVNGNVLTGTGDVLVEPVIPTGTALEYLKGDKTLGILDKTAVGLSNVDNTSDLLKPISTAQALVNTAQDLINTTQADTNLLKQDKIDSANKDYLKYFRNVKIGAFLIGNQSVGTEFVAEEKKLGIKFDYGHIFFSQIEFGSQAQANTIYTNRIKPLLDLNKEVFVNFEFLNLSPSIAALNTDLTTPTSANYRAVQYLCTAIQNAGTSSRIIMTAMHERNGDWYPWGAFKSNNLIAGQPDIAGSNLNITNFINVKNAFSTGIRFVDQINYLNYNSNNVVLLKQFYNPLCDLVGVSVYNKYMQNANFGETYTMFRSWFESFYKQYKSILGFDKKFMVCETACVHDNAIVSATVTGTQVGAYTGTPTITIPSTIAGADATLTIVGTNPVTSVTITKSGGYFGTVTPITLNNGAIITPIVSASTVGYLVGKTKAQWIADLYSCLDLFPDITYLTYFIETLYYPFTLEEKRNMYIGKEQASYNQLKNWYTIANWSRSGTNQGAVVSNIVDYPINIYNINNLASVRLTHNGTAGLASTNRYIIGLTQTQAEADRTWTVIFWAKSSVANFNLDVSIQAAVSFDTTSTNQHIISEADKWQMFKVKLAHRQAGTSTSPFNLRFSIGQNAQAANIDIWGLGVFYEGQFTTDDLLKLEK